MDKDKQAGRQGLLRKKLRQKTVVYISLCDLLLVEGYLDTMQDHIKSTIGKAQDLTSHDLISQTVLLYLALVQRRFKDAIDLADKFFDKVTKSDVSLDLASAAACAANIALQIAHSMKPPLPEETRKDVLLRQWRYITCDIETLKRSNHEGFLVRARYLVLTALDCIKS